MCEVSVLSAWCNTVCEVSVLSAWCNAVCDVSGAMLFVMFCEKSLM